MIGLLTRYARTQFISPFAISQKSLKINGGYMRKNGGQNSEEDESDKNEEEKSEKKHVGGDFFTVRYLF
jgi:hypothetical protein